MTGRITKDQLNEYIKQYSEWFTSYDLMCIETYGKAFCTVWDDSLVITKINDDEYDLSWHTPTADEVWNLQQLTEK